MPDVPIISQVETDKQGDEFEEISRALVALF